MTKNLMIDMETLGNRPGAPIVSLGAVVFDEEKLYDELYFVTRPNPTDLFEFDAICFWMRQSDEARMAIFSEENQRRARDIYFVLSELELFYVRQRIEYVWSHGATYDVTLLEEAYKRRSAGAKPPWNHRTPRDTRTLFKITGVNIPETFTPKHNALADAKNQALAVQESWRILGGWKAAYEKQLTMQSEQYADNLPAQNFTGGKA